jgi:hypothetical protein
MQFGKYDDDFHLDFKHPLTGLQAFGIVLSCFSFPFWYE